ncbi:MAG: UDP-N-acetylmuramoyl-tripeptide--D-alanyl-D-alanine ligase [Candidatus Cybelea sp.]
MRLPIDLAVEAANATIFERQIAPATVRASTDTRTIEPGDTFVALHGECFDGHDFAEEAVRRGATMLVLDRLDARLPGIAVMLVDDTKAAYMALAGAARAFFRGRVIAITGSTGKTTTKSLLAQLLAVKYRDRVLAAPENENNEIGVSKLLLNAAGDAHDVLVIEMGARRYGDVSALVEIARPQLGILTNIGEAHLEIMGSRERLEATKWGLFSGGARAILNVADEVARRRAPSLDTPAHWFGAVRSPLEADVELEPLTAIAGDRLVHRCKGRIAEYPIDVRLPGLHNRANLAAAIAGALELEVPLERLLDEIPKLRLPRGRYDRIAVEGGIHFIYDAYNANASGMIAALDAFASEAASRRIAVLASMAELGEESQTLHERVGAHAASKVDVLLVRGEYATDLARGAKRGGLKSPQIVFVETNARAVRWLREHVRPDDVVLLKGSRKYKLEEIVEELRS